MPLGDAGVDTVGVHEKGNIRKRGDMETRAQMICRIFFMIPGFAWATEIPKLSSPEERKKEDFKRLDQ